MKTGSISSKEEMMKILIRRLGYTLSIALLSATLAACGGGGGSPEPTPTPTSSPTPTPTPPPSAKDTDGDGLTDAEEIQIGTHPSVRDTDGDGFLDKEEVENWDPGTGNHLRFNPLVADVPRLRVQRLGTPDIQLIAETVESGAFTRGMSNESENEVKVTTDRGRTNTHVVEEQHAVNVNAEVKKRGPITSGKVEASYDYEHTDTTTETNYWNETKVESNRQASSDFFSKMESETVTTKGGEIKILMGLLNDGDVSYTVNNMDLTAYMENAQKPGDLIAVGTLTHAGSMTFTPNPLGSQINPTSADFTPFTFEYTTANPEQIRRVLEQSNQLILKPANLSLTGTRPDVDLNLAAQNIRARTAEVIIDYGDSQARRTERYRVAVDNGNGSSLSFDDLMSDRLNVAYSFSAQTFPGVSGSFNGLSSVRSLAMNSGTHSYWLVAHTFTPDGSPVGTTDTRLYNILNESYSAASINLRKGDVLHLVYVTDTDLDGLSDRLEVLQGTDLNNADSDGDGLDDAMEIYGWFSNLASPPCDVGEQHLVFSNPLLADSDGDNLTDLFEFDACTNPKGDLSINAGGDQLVSVGGNIALNAQAENFLNAASLQYQWVQTDGVSVGQLPATASLNFSAPAGVSRLEFEVTVTDVDNGQSASDRVAVFVANDAARAVFIDPDFGDDFNNSGISPDSPLKSIDRALTLFPGDDLYLNTPDGGAVYQLAETLNPGTGSLYGGFDLDWTHDPANAPTPIVMDQAVAIHLDSSSEQTLSGISILARPPADGKVNSAAIEAVGTAGHLILDRVIAQGGNLSVPATMTEAQINAYVAGSSYGVIASSLERLDILSSQLTGGSGGPGVKGVTGAPGRTGDRGTNASGTTGGGGGTGHNGENGGKGANAAAVAVCAAGSSGAKGTNSVNNSGGTISGGAGGAAGTATFVVVVCSDMSAGGSGGSVTTRARTGSQGAGAGNSTGFNGVSYLPNAGGTGGQGTGGAGGGGGGSGPGLDFNAGGGGGGGGEGGEGGLGGRGGRGAGGSFGLAVSAVTFVSVSDSTISSANGVSGGAGGNGGTGGDGGGGGTGADSGIRKGGNGGSGGPGGHGGAGGGGSGGPVAGILLLNNSTLDLLDSVITTGNAGNGSSPNRGQGGWNYGIFQVGSSVNRTTGSSYQLGLAGNNAEVAEINP
jgi:hypothetical protein